MTTTDPYLTFFFFRNRAQAAANSEVTKPGPVVLLGKLPPVAVQYRARKCSRELRIFHSLVRTGSQIWDLM